MRASFLGDLSGTGLRDDESGVYMWPDAKGNMQPYMSVTSILSVISKSILPGWYAGQEWMRCRDLVQQVKMGEMTGKELFAKYPAKDKPKGWIAAGSVYRDEKAEIGSLVHHAITQYVIARESALPPGIEDMRPEVQAHMWQFHRWFEQNKPRYHFIEGPVFHPDMWAGTCDCRIALADDYDDEFPMDNKTGNQVWPEHALQVTAYGRAAFLGIKSEFKEIPLKPAKRGAVLHVTADHCKLFWMPCGELEWETFQHAQALHKWKHSAAMPEEE